jgi:hypothetical protein
MIRNIATSVATVRLSCQSSLRLLIVYRNIDFAQQISKFLQTTFYEGLVNAMLELANDTE